MNSTNGNVVEEPFALKIVLRLFYVLVFSVGLCGNLLVCIVIVQQHRMRTVINYFTLNLALSDLIVIIIYLPSQLQHRTSVSVRLHSNTISHQL